MPAFIWMEIVYLDPQICERQGVLERKIMVMAKVVLVY